MKLSSILGLNARFQLYSAQYNNRRARKIANSKLLTKKYLKKAGIPAPKIFKKFRNDEDIWNYDWKKLPESFALKPSRGLGGEGIIVVKKKSPDKEGWITTTRKRVSFEDLKLHTLDILEGAFSEDDVQDIAFCEEFVGRHSAFRRYAYRGTPDIRVVVFNKVPVMAMLRLPTKESGGRANLHQGAIGVGIDMATGITTRALWHGDFIKFKPGTTRKLNGLKIPMWSKILELAAQTQIISGLGYVGVDIVLHPEKGPMVLEINSEPGLSIQLVNMAGLKKRLERVEDLDIRDAAHGVKIAQALFTSSFADRVRAEEGIKTVSAVEEIKVKGENKKTKKVFAKLDTGAWRTAISDSLAQELGLLKPENILWERKVRSSLGVQTRPIVNLTFWLAGRKFVTPASVANRKMLRYPIIIGRRDLRGMLVDPQIPEGKFVSKKR